MTGSHLLNPQDPHPVREIPAGSGESAFVLIGDHAGTAIPEALGDLGLSCEDRARHIAVDIGVEALGKALSAQLGAAFVSQTYSRLVCDCNRDPADPEWIVETSDGTPVPGNRGLSEAEREQRRCEIFEPYQQAIGDCLDERGGRDTVLVSLHSFTPVMRGERRPWEIGVLHDRRRDDYALRLLDVLRQREGWVVADNEPYRMDATDYTVPRHAYPRGLRYVELEVRQDLLGDAAGIARVAALLAETLPQAL